MIKLGSLWYGANSYSLMLYTEKLGMGLHGDEANVKYILHVSYKRGEGGGSLHSPPAAPDLYFPSCRSSYIPAYMLGCCKKGCERSELTAMKRS